MTCVRLTRDRAAEAPKWEPQPRSQGSEGTILVWALLFSVVSAAMIVSHAAYMAANRTEMRVHYEHAALADAFARSGLTDTLGWFQRQSTQPVQTFAPQYQPSGDPPLWDTIDPSIGLVQEFEVRGNLWGRYEVRSVDLADISSERGANTDGMVWDVPSRGFLYHLADPNKPFNEAPNRIIASSYVRTEIRGIALDPPAQAAVAIDDPDDLDLGPGVVIVGGPSPGVAYPPLPVGEIAPVTPLEVGGTPPMVEMVTYEAEPLDVFSMNYSKLESMSEYVVTEEEAQEAAGGGGGDGSAGFALPEAIPGAPSAPAGTWEWQRERFAPGTGQKRVQRAPRELEDEVVYFPGDLTVGTGMVIEGRTLLVINGNLIVADDGELKLRGLVYVNGDATLDGNVSIDGMLVVRGKLRAGHGTGTVSISYNAMSITSLKKNVERYRMSRSIRPGWSTP